MPCRLSRVVLLAFLFLLGLLLGLAGCAPANTRAEVPKPLQVYATIYPLYDFAAKIAGERAQVHLLLPPGADIHSWEPGVQTLRDLEGADLLIYSGAGLEPWVDKVAAALANSRLKLAEASRGVDFLRLADAAGHGSQPEASHALYDPHVWLDPVRAKALAANIRDALVAADPAGGEFYEARYRALARRLDRLDFFYRLILAQVRTKKFVVSHAAFGYLASRYGLVQLALTSSEGEAEPSPASLARITAFYRQEGAKYLFVDSLHGAKAAAAVAQEVGVQLLPLHHLSSLTPEQLAAGEDYFSLMEENLFNLYRGLE